MLEPTTLWDGGGAVVYWRPLARQVYYELLGPLMLEAPRAIGLLHAALLALAAVLIYRVLRPRWSGPWAAAAATFPVLAESSRVLLLWPSAFQDLGALLFSALALHEAARGRRWTALPALLAALLCKEIAVVTALLLPWMPEVSRGQSGGRGRWFLGVAAILALWGVGYLLVLQNAHVVFQRHLESGAPSWPRRLAWALVNGVDDAFNLRALPSSLAVPLGSAAALVIAVAIEAAIRHRSRLTGASRWIGWGATWFAACTIALGEVWPVWGPFRSAVPMVGLGIACVGQIRSLGGYGLVALVALRLVGLALSPLPAERIVRAPPGPVAGLELPSLVRLQRFVAETRRALLTDQPALPHGASVAELHRPLMAEHAFADGKALRVWYRDTTLRWVTWSDLASSPPAALAAAVEYEPRGSGPIVVVSPAAVHAYFGTREPLAAERYHEALAGLDRADSLQQDRGAAVFLGRIAGRRAICLLGLGDIGAAWKAAGRSVAFWPEGNDSRYVLAVLLELQGRRAEARAQLDTLLAHHPFDASARDLLDSLALDSRPGAR